jgi:hypothetical protein
VSACKSITVTREYKPAPHDCVRALELLLKKPVNHGRSPALPTPEDTRGESKHDSRARISIHK